MIRSPSPTLNGVTESFPLFSGCKYEGSNGV